MQSDDDRTIRSGEEDVDLPDELIQGLKRVDRAVAVVSPDADRRVAEAASAHFGQRPRRARAARLRWAMAGSLAASLLVGVLFWRTQTPMEPIRVANVVPVPNDIDGSGAVDILDAFALARMAHEGSVPATRAKTDSVPRMARTDGASATRAEVDALAMSIVALDGTAERL